MTDEDRELHQLLRKLHDELGRADSIDDESRELLGLIAADVGALPSAQEDAAGHVPALERLAVRFESEYPSLSAVARQIADLLAKAGI
jgi:hypothetical protein